MITNFKHIETMHEANKPNGYFGQPVENNDIDWNIDFAQNNIGSGMT